MRRSVSGTVDLLFQEINQAAEGIEAHYLLRARNEVRECVDVVVVKSTVPIVTRVLDRRAGFLHVRLLLPL